VAKKVQIDFALKTPAALAERLGVSQARMGRLVAIVGESNSDKNGGGSRHVAFRSNSRAVNSRSARRNNTKTAR
jgi:hypothetical protein